MKLKTLMIVGGGYALWRHVEQTYGWSTLLDRARDMLRGPLGDGALGADADTMGTVPTEPRTTLPDMPAVAGIAGIADVDPEPLSSPLEAVDPDATAAAHDIGRMRDRLPR